MDKYQIKVHPTDAGWYALYCNGWIIDTCYYTDYSKLEDWETEIEGYAWDSIAKEVWLEECNRYD